MPPRGPTKRAHMNYFCDLMMQIEWDLHQKVLDDKRVPPAWNEIARERPRRTKTRLTLRLEDDVVKFFRSFGKGYQERMNDVLAAWMHGRLAGVIEGPETEGHGFGTADVARRPEVGDTDAREEMLNARFPPEFRTRRG